MLTLWDVVKKSGRAIGWPTRATDRRALPPPVGARAKQAPALQIAHTSRTKNPPAQARYDAVARLMLETYGVKVRRWRKSMSGIAWHVAYADGSTARLIESPRPKGPVSASVFLHEIGHHAIGFNRFKPRCVEEYHAWMWSLEAMKKHNLNITPAVTHRVHASLHYALAKARRRGLKTIPPELLPYTQRPIKKSNTTD